MKIALLGYGKMGKAIEKIALNRGHEIILKIDTNSNSYDILAADIAIDFSTPTSAYKNISNCINNNIPVISGTTGWYKDYDKIVALCKEKNGAFISATNFSLGVNIFFKLNERLAKMMAKLHDYNVSIEEIHHTEKLDAPSGTAITLAEGIIKNSDKKEWELNVTNSKQSLPIISKRISEVSGTHSITYTSSVDTLEIKHTAHNREGFALGAVIATEWLIDKKGVYTMKDVLGI
ncbi:MAG: 4-hydroxy-tetrahydrodipicolinate reductase [Flavobacteriaceae bacterium]|nr:4-hydroxy-tetrahydrodipicolinate reductase [Flavobacteriaceae bacterium]